MNIAIIFAGGVGKRMQNGALPKQFLKIKNKPIIIHTLSAFEQCDDIDKIIVVMVDDYIEYMNKLLNYYHFSKIEAVVAGGETSQLSIYQGLLCASKIRSDSRKIVLIHDGVRPFVDDKLIHNNIVNVKKHGNAISCVKQNETTVLVDAENIIFDTTERANTYIAKAPQSFYLEDILSYHKIMMREESYNNIDSCTMMLKLGKEPYLVECNYDNVKITNPVDYYIAKAIFEVREGYELFGG